MLEGLKASVFLLIPSLQTRSPVSRLWLQPLVANQEVSSLRMRGHQLEARPGLEAPLVSSPLRLCLSCVIIPSQLGCWARDSLATGPQSSPGLGAANITSCELTIRVSGAGAISLVRPQGMTTRSVVTGAIRGEPGDPGAA